ncbi:reverse transcriptase family protein [Winogradskyella poriferorum]|uniref:reverse transcriptase family protein n=1 Tax=Winogradskyella poriferorum TaxID=307627 RepID=UPI003D64E767
MKLQKPHIEKIKSDFMEMQTIHDFLDLINFVNKLLYGSDSRSFKLRQIAYYSVPNYIRKKRIKDTEGVFKTNTYHTFSINKKSGGKRIIHAPNKTLKKKQRIFSVILQCVFNPTHSSYGFIRDRSIVDNARVHLGNYYIYNIDIKNFFSSIDQARVWKCLQLSPFHLNSEYNNGDRLKIANIIANISCVDLEVERFNEKGQLVKVVKDVLPQGAPTSPILTNVVCQRLDYLLTGIAKRFGLKYSRYADDITFSSLHNVYQKDSKFLHELDRIIKDQGFCFNVAKTRLQVNGMKKEVTGLVVNDKLNVNKRYIKQLRMWLYYWEEYGYEKASEIFSKDYQKDNGHNAVKENVSFKNVLYGKLNFLKMVKGVEDNTYVKLKNRYVKLAKELKIKQKIEERKRDEKRYLELKNYFENKPEKDEGDFDNIIADLMLKGELSRLERKLRIKIKLPEKPNTKSNNELPKLHNPKKLVALLKKFSKNESALKYTTHSWDAGRDLEKFKDINEFIKIAREEYAGFSKDLNSLSKTLNALIYNFVFNPDVHKEGWGAVQRDERIEFGWSSSELIKACNADLSLNPEDYMLPEKYWSLKKGVTIQKFKQVIDFFKNQIEIRDENSALLKLILSKHKKHLAQENFEIHNRELLDTLEDKTFYTDVQALDNALELIFKCILKKKQHPNISYQVRSLDDAYVLEISHIGSSNQFKSIKDNKLNIDAGDFGSIATELNNLCDWSIESTFKEGPHRINFLVSDSEISAHEKIDSADGFKYILTFYK